MTTHKERWMLQGSRDQKEFERRAVALAKLAGQGTRAIYIINSKRLVNISVGSLKTL